MNLLDWINQGITSLTTTSGPSIDALGFRMFVALLTTMMVWFGVQEALSSAQCPSRISAACWGIRQLSECPLPNMAAQEVM